MADPQSTEDIPVEESNEAEPQEYHYADQYARYDQEYDEHKHMYEKNDEVIDNKPQVHQNINSQEQIEPEQKQEKADIQHVVPQEPPQMSSKPLEQPTQQFQQMPYMQMPADGQQYQYMYPQHQMMQPQAKSGEGTQMQYPMYYMPVQHPSAPGQSQGDGKQPMMYMQPMMMYPQQFSQSQSAADGSQPSLYMMPQPMQPFQPKGKSQPDA